MSQNNLPTAMPAMQKLIQRTISAEKSQQKEIKISIQEARELSNELALLTTRMAQNISEIKEQLKEIKGSNIDVKFDGGNF